MHGTIRSLSMSIRTLTITAALAAAGLSPATSFAQSVSPTPGSTLAQPSGPKVETLRVLGLALTRLTRHAEFAEAAAKQADSESRAAVASLFRAMARSSSIHAGLMRARITALGGTPTIDAAVPATPVKTTTENLLAAQAALNTLKDTDLPAWRRSAEAEGNRDAVTSLRWTRESTIEWGRFVKDAIDASPTSPSAKSPAEAAKKDFFISRTCGFPVEKLDFQKCPVCRSGRDDFEKVN